MLNARLRLALFELDESLRLSRSLLVQEFLAAGQLLGATAELFLENLTGLLSLGQGDGPFTEGLPLRIEPFLRLGELRQPALQL